MLEYFHPGDAEDARVLIKNIENRIAKEGLGRNLTLASGQAGLAVYYSLMHEYRPDAGFDVIARAIADTVIDSCAEGKIVDFRFFAGLTGIGFALERSFQMLNGKGAVYDDINEDLDFLVLKILSIDNWDGHYDLINGLVGFGVYILSRPESENRNIAFGRLLTQLKRLMKTSENGFAWETDRKFFGFESTDLPTDLANFNLGLAHGNTGVVLLLAWAVSKQVCVAEAIPILAGATKWLQSRASSSGLSSFGYVEGDGKASRIAWCYGDLGSALAIVRSGKALRDNEVYTHGIEIGTKVANRSRATAMINDHGLCHGTAGVGLMFSALHRDTENVRFLSAARDWYGETVRAGVADFENLSAFKDDRTHGIEFGLLTGVSGIAMALIDATTFTPREWSKWLLI